MRGLHNLIFLAGIVLTVLLQSEAMGRAAGGWFGIDLTLVWPWGEVIMLGLAGLAYFTTGVSLRKANGFEWGAILEVAILFVAIFVTMVPALALLSQLRGTVTEPWQFFWLTGALSSFLDNAPTYLAFASLASGDPEHLAGLMEPSKAPILAAISCGAVFMGANTYIGNGPNFMVKAIADHAGYKTPYFLGYMVYSSTILLPIFVLVTLIFFPPW